MEIKERIEKILKENKVVLFMKGEKDLPMCGFSGIVNEILNKKNIDFTAVNVLEDEELREGIKKYSDWPTIPQLYIKGEFIGGADIVKQMFVDGSLEEKFKQAE